MKRIALFFILFSLMGTPVKTFATDIQEIFAEMAREIGAVNKSYMMLIEPKNARLAEIRDSLQNKITMDKAVSFLIEKDALISCIELLKEENANEVSKVRYLKGLQVIKILYEKVLSLDHHFASVRTLNEINRIGNPNQYPEYTRLKQLVAEKKDKKTGFDLSALLGGNAIVSLVQTFSSMISSGLTRAEKEKEIGSIECVLDFTMRMQNDLNTIYFETAFLQTSNDKIRQDIEVLFRDYTKPIGYNASLEQCRKSDDWEDINQKMDEYLAKMKTVSGTSQYKMKVNVEFPIDRLLQFISQYNAFIDQGGKFYEKFSIILNSYENEKQCESKLPAEYKKLKSDIDLAIQKFNTAYKPVEINGSRMKEILYGLNEFE